MNHHSAVSLGTLKADQNVNFTHITRAQTHRGNILIIQQSVSSSKGVIYKNKSACLQRSVASGKETYEFIS